jgi:hypothetical protein
MFVMPNQRGGHLGQAAFRQFDKPAPEGAHAD